MHQQCLILLHPRVKRKMHLKENTLFDLDLWVKITTLTFGSRSQPLPLGQGHNIDLGVKVTQNVAQCPLHHVTYAPTEFEVTTSKALGDTFTRKFNI